MTPDAPSIVDVAVPPRRSAAETSPQENQLAIAPVRLDERISALDSVRGFALLGILLMNVCSFGLPFAAYESPVAAGGFTGLNLAAWSTMAVLADGKMRAIFSMAFGASVYLLIDRLTRKGAAADAADIHYRRMLWLLLFGVIHGYLIWSGDILFAYASVGLILYPLRKLSPRTLLIAAGAMVLAMCGYQAQQYLHIVKLQRGFAQTQADEKAGKKLTSEQETTKKEFEAKLKEFTPSPDDLKQETDAHLNSYAKLFVLRAKQTHDFQSFPIYQQLDIIVMMFVGMALMKLGVLRGSYSIGFYVWMALLGFAVGISTDVASTWWVIRNHFDFRAWYLTGIPYEIGRFTAFGYVALVILLVKSEVLRFATRTLADVGRMAFSNYILTSLICTTIFEGYGFGLFGKLQRYQLYGVVLGVWLVILIVSPIWLRHFRFGPLEWAWRSLTYWKKQPLRIQQSTAV